MKKNSKKEKQLQAKILQLEEKVQRKKKEK